jgi:hypothetical protein
VAVVSWGRDPLLPGPHLPQTLGTGGIALLLAVLGPACLEPQVYPCTEHAQCVLDGHEPGRCLAGACAYPSSDCASGYRYGPSADGLSGVCVEGGDGGSTGIPEASSEGSVGGTGQGCPDECTTPPGACVESVGLCDLDSGTCVYAPLPEGTPCGGAADPCFDVGTCDGAGNCSGEPVVCDAPTGPCFEAAGTCNPAIGVCTYAPLAEGSPCSDGSECTVGDACDGAGSCVPGPVCPTDNPCEASTCVRGACVYDPLADGDSCGPRAADRCCGGTCVDISTDDAHCGGCFAACVASQSCESIAVTTMCTTKPADTSGRCTCAANAECPFGQICRTHTPHPWYCAPESVNACAGEFFQLDGCPNYCGY